MIQPEDLAAFVGSKISVKCYSYSKPKWTKSLGNAKFTVRKLIVKCMRAMLYVHELSIFKAETQHTGEYKCQGTKRNGLTFERNTFIYIGGKFIVHLQFCCDFFVVVLSY